MSVLLFSALVVLMKASDGCSWVLNAYSFLSRVPAPSLTLSVTLSRLWGRNKGLPGPGVQRNLGVRPWQGCNDQQDQAGRQSACVL